MIQLALAVLGDELVPMGLSEASALIDWLDGLDRKAAAVVPVPDGARLLEGTEQDQGVYRRGRDIYVVKLGPSGNLYAKRLLDENGDRVLDVVGEPVDPDDRPRFIRESAPGMAKRLTTADRLSLEDARQLMTRYGRCLYCSHKIGAAASVARMTGSVCKDRFAA